MAFSYDFSCRLRREKKVFNTDLIEQYTSGLESVVANGSI